VAVRHHADLDNVEGEIEIKTPVGSFQHRQGRMCNLRADIVSGEHRDLHCSKHSKIIRAPSTQTNARPRMESIGP
jgi:hypothetical protein